MTAYGTIESAVEAMRLGAFDYIQKPFTEQELLVKVAKALDNRRLAGEVTFLASEFKDRYKFENIIGRSQRRARGARPHRAHRARPTPSCSSPARAARARSSSPRPSTPTASAPIARSSRSTAPPSPRRCSRASSSATRRGSFTGAVSARKGLFEEADGGHVLLRRDRRDAHHLPGQAPARHPGERDPARRREQADPRQRAHHRRDQPGPARRPSPRSASGRTSTTGSTSRASSSRRCASGARTSRSCSSFFLEKYNRKMGVRAELHDDVHRGARRTTTSPATSASSST